MDAMSGQLATRLLVVLSIAYGVAIAILASLDSPAMTNVAIIGAVILGGLWAVRGVIFGRNRSS
jgi:hypothetical protein